MAKRKKGRTRQAVEALEVTIRRDLERGSFKPAVKNARVAYRQDATAANRLLLQRALMGRAEQLYNQGFLQQARDLLMEVERAGERPGDLDRRGDRL